MVVQGPPKKVPKTQDNTREADETVVLADDEEVRDQHEDIVNTMYHV